MTESHQKRAILQVLDDGRPLDTLFLTRDVTVIGRESGDIVLDDNEISSSHCQIQKIQNEYHLFDLNSTNGTFLNGLKIVKSRLKKGDLIRIGFIDLRFDFIEADVPRENEKKTKDLLLVENLPAVEDPEAISISQFIAEEIEKNRTWRAVIEICYPNQEVDTIALINDIPFVVGRVESTGRFELDDEISRRHAKIHVDARGAFQVEDLGSTNGTFVNEAPLKGSIPLQTGDVVRVGNTRITCRMILD